MLPAGSATPRNNHQRRRGGQSDASSPPSSPNGLELAVATEEGGGSTTVGPFHCVVFLLRGTCQATWPARSDMERPAGYGRAGRHRGHKRDIANGSFGGSWEKRRNDVNVTVGRPIHRRRPSCLAAGLFSGGAAGGLLAARLNLEIGRAGSQPNHQQERAPPTARICTIRPAWPPATACHWRAPG